ncbi:Arsenical-resistance protein, partial [Phytophthora palmivora]
YASFFLNTMPSTMEINGDSQGQEDLHISVSQVTCNVGIYMGISFVLGIAGWVFLRRLAVAALLFTIVVLFASQSQCITTTVGSVVFSMVPFMIYFVAMFTGSKCIETAALLFEKRYHSFLIGRNEKACSA